MKWKTFLNKTNSTGYFQAFNNFWTFFLKFQQPFPLQHLHSMTDSTNECDEIGRHIHCQQHSQPVNGNNLRVKFSKYGFCFTKICCATLNEITGPAEWILT